MPVDVLNVTRSANQPILVKVAFPHEDGDVPPLDVSRDFFESLHMTVTSRGAWTGQLVLFDRTSDFLLSLLSTEGFGRLVQIQWGWDDGRGIDIYPTYFGQWVSFLPEVTAEGMHLTFELASLIMPDQAVKKVNRRFHVGAQISEIVRFIAEEREWESVDRFGRDTIQVTPNARLTEPLIQDMRETDFQFIIDRLLPRAAPESGGPFYFFVDPYNIVHFHQAHFLPEQQRVRYFFGQDAMGSVIEFAPSDLRWVMSVLGAGTAEFRGVDSLTGQKLRLGSTDLGGLPDLRESVEAGGENLTPVFPEAASENPPISAVRSVVARTEADFIQKVRALYAKLRRLAYQASLTVRGTHAVLPVETIRVVYLPASGDTLHFLSGNFTVVRVEHDVGAGGWQTRMEMVRVGVSPTPATSPIGNSDKIPSPPETDQTPAAQADARKVGATMTRETQAQP